MLLFRRTRRWRRRYHLVIILCRCSSFSWWRFSMFYFYFYFLQVAHWNHRYQIEYLASLPERVYYRRERVVQIYILYGVRRSRLDKLRADRRSTRTAARVLNIRVYKMYFIHILVVIVRCGRPVHQLYLLYVCIRVYERWNLLHVDSTVLTTTRVMRSLIIHGCCKEAYRHCNMHTHTDTRACVYYTHT